MWRWLIPAGLLVYMTAMFLIDGGAMWLERYPWLIPIGLLTILAAMFVVSEGAIPAPPPPPLERSIYDNHLLDVDRAALEEAYHNQVELLFQTWMRDESGQPDRAIAGIRKAQHAYIAALRGADQREQEIKRNPLPK